jgi:O-6-methylguanine DNA methyltransferase
VECRDGSVAGVTLGRKGAKDDRKLAADLECVLDGGKVPAHLRAATAGLPGFTRSVLNRCARIPHGKVMTYSELARAAGKARAARAVGQVMAANPFALLIPCHRVVGSDHSLHGFGGGLGMKEWLLAREGWQFEGEGRSRRLRSEVKVQRSTVKGRTRKGPGSKTRG